MLPDWTSTGAFDLANAFRRFMMRPLLFITAPASTASLATTYPLAASFAGLHGGGSFQGDGAVNTYGYAYQFDR